MVKYSIILHAVLVISAVTGQSSLLQRRGGRVKATATDMMMLRCDSLKTMPPTVLYDQIEI